MARAFRYTARPPQPQTAQSERRSTHIALNLLGVSMTQKFFPAWRIWLVSFRYSTASLAPKAAARTMSSADRPLSGGILIPDVKKHPQHAPHLISGEFRRTVICDRPLSET